MKLKKYVCCLVFGAVLFGLNVTQVAANSVAIVKSSGATAVYTKIQDAINVVVPGDTIRLSPGTYFETLTASNKSGTAAAPIAFEGNGSGVVVDGAYEPLTHANNGLWQAENSVGAGVYSTAFDFTPQDVPFAMKADDTLLWTYPTLPYLKEFYSGQGIFLDTTAHKLYVHLTNDQNPNEVPLYVSTATSVLYMPNTSFWRVRNIEFRHGARAAVFSRFTVQHVVFENLTVRTGGDGFLFWGTGTNMKVIGGTYIQKRDPNWWWSDVKTYQQPKTMEDVGIRMDSWQNSEIAHATVDGFFDGIDVNGGNENKVHDNTIHNTYDDAMEIEASTAFGRTEVYANTIYDTFVALSFAPASGGPFYVYRNTAVTNKKINFERSTKRSQYGIIFKLGGKAGITPTENVKAYQNTFWAMNTAVGFWAGNELWKNFEFYNNIFYSQNRAVVSDSGLGSADNFYNGNLYFRETAGSLLDKWNSTVNNNYGTLDAAINSADGIAAGWEKQGIQANPGFVGSAAPIPDLRIGANSPARDKGISLAGKGWPDTGVVTDGKPDIGANEYSANPRSPTPTTSTLLIGDINGDGIVNALDFVRLFESFGKRTGQTGFDGRADIAPTGAPDGTVNALDYVILFEHFGEHR